MVELKTLNEVVQGIINDIHDKLPDIDTKEGTFIRDVFIDPVSDEIVGLNMDMKLLEYSQSILTASGEDLDRLATNYNITRKSAKVSNGFIRFYIRNVNLDAVIKANTKVCTSPNYTEESKIFITSNTKDTYYVSNNSTIDVITNKDTYNFIYKDNLTLDSNGYYYYDIPATSESAGSAYNVSANTITVKSDTLDSNILSFTNPISFTGGSDQENDSALVLRIKLALQGANIGTKYGYLSYVLKQDSVEDAKVVAAGDDDMIRDNKDGGKVDIYIKGQELESNELSMILSSDNTYINNDGYYTDLNISSIYKPIRQIDSISYSVNNNDESSVDNFKNVENFEFENIDSSFTKLDDVNTSEQIKEKIKYICDLYNLNSVSKDSDLNVKHYGYVTFPEEGLNLDEDNPYKYEYIDDGEAKMEPYAFNLYKDSNNQNIIISFTFGYAFIDDSTITEENPDGEYTIQSIYDCTIIKSSINNEETLYVYNGTTSDKNYYKDNLLNYNNLFSTIENDDGSLEQNFDNEIIIDTVKNIVNDENKNTVVFNYLYNYLLSEDVNNSILYYIDYIRDRLDNYKYYLDFGAEDIVNKTIYINPYIYIYNEIEDDYLNLSVNISNNPNIYSGYFTILIDNSNNYLTIEDYISSHEITIQNNNDNITINFDFNMKDYESNDNLSTTLLNIKFKKINSTALNCRLSNVHIYDDQRNVFQYKSYDSVIDIETNEDGEIIESISQFEKDKEKLILFYLKEHCINNVCYKIDMLFPIEVSFVENNIENNYTYNIPITVVKKNDNLYIRTYYVPDYELINYNEELLGNSISTTYKIKWYNNPFNVQDGNLPITISYEYNNLIHQLQEDIEGIKCLTADVLVKEAKEYPIEIIMDVSFDESYDMDETKNNIIDTVTEYVNESFSLGGILKKSDLVTLIQQMDGVNYLDSCCMEIRKIFEESQTIIAIKDYEYFNLRNIIINAI